MGSLRDLRPRRGAGAQSGSRRRSGSPSKGREQVAGYFPRFFHGRTPPCSILSGRQI